MISIMRKMTLRLLFRDSCTIWFEVPDSSLRVDRRLSGSQVDLETCQPVTGLLSACLHTLDGFLSLALEDILSVLPSVSGDTEHSRSVFCSERLFRVFGSWLRIE